MNAPGGVRTHDLRFRKPLLYPAELRALCGKMVPHLVGIKFSYLLRLPVLQALDSRKEEHREGFGNGAELK